MADVLASDHGIRVAITHHPDPAARAHTPKRRFDATDRTVHLAGGRLTAGQRAFQLATQLAMETQSEVIDDIIAGADDLSDEAVPVARIGLANYFAGALLLPYEIFRQAADAAHYDIELLSLGFEVGFETICHRLSTLQRPGSRGIPFIFVRVDRAGNISKRQSATAFHFSRVGGSCPLWVVHDAFATPGGRVLTQVSAMPDGRSYFWLARTTVEPGGYLTPSQEFRDRTRLRCRPRRATRLLHRRRPHRSPGRWYPSGGPDARCATAPPPARNALSPPTRATHSRRPPRGQRLRALPSPPAGTGLTGRSRTPGGEPVKPDRHGAAKVTVAALRRRSVERIRCKSGTDAQR